MTSQSRSRSLRDSDDECAAAASEQVTARVGDFDFRERDAAVRLHDAAVRDDYACAPGTDVPQIALDREKLRRILAHNLFNEARRFAARQRDASREVSLEALQTGLDNSSLTLGRCLTGGGPSPSSRAKPNWWVAR